MPYVGGCSTQWQKPEECEVGREGLMGRVEGDLGVEENEWSEGEGARVAV